MAYRFTNTEKWADSWFSSLTQFEMILFIYLCDNCDIAGFIEINLKRWANDLNSSIDEIPVAIKGLQRGLVISKSNDCIFLKNFIKHQKNFPLNEKNKAHLGIIKRFNLYAEKFDIQDINSFIQGTSKGLPSPTGIGKGIGNNIYNSKIINNKEINNKEKYSQIVPKDISECFGELIQDELWKEGIMMTQRVTSFEFIDYLTKFEALLKNDGENEKSINDAKKHFNRWLGIQLKNRNNNINGLTKEQILDINSRNSARNSIGLSPLTEDDYKKIILKCK